MQLQSVVWMFAGSELRFSSNPSIYKFLSASTLFCRRIGFLGLMNYTQPRSLTCEVQDQLAHSRIHKQFAVPLLAFIMHLHRKHSSLCTMMWIGGEPGGAHVNTKCTLMYEVQHKHGRLLSQSVMISEVPSHMHSSQLQTLIILTVKLIVEYIMLRVFLFQKKIIDLKWLLVWTSTSIELKVEVPSEKFLM